MKNRTNKKPRSLFAKIYLGIILLFLYAPILTLMIYSFNESKSRAKWGGFTLKWYADLFTNSSILNALYVTLAIAVLAALFSTILGVVASLSIYNMRAKPQAVMLSLSRLPMLTPDIVTGVSLMILFIFMRIPLGFFTMLLAHISFDVPYVVFSILPKLQQMDPHIYEAALDLGATPAQAFWKAIVPEILPGIGTGAIIAFTMSLDDFVISFFTTSTVQNLSTTIYSMARLGISPTINALSTIMFIVVMALLLIANKRSSLVNQE